MTELARFAKVRGVDRVLEPSDPDYPARLRELADPPRRLHIRGELWRPFPTVAIVGSRAASELGRALAFALGEGLAAAGVSVVSGGALGIDAAAHAGALSSGRTVVVLPTSLERPSPSAHRALFRAVLERGGAWLSEREGPAKRSHFRTRNRVIAALADLVVVVEAGPSSGTLHTIRAARRLGRALATVPWTPGDARGATCREVLRVGGRSVVDAADVLALLGLKPSRRRPAAEVERDAILWIREGRVPPVRAHRAAPPSAPHASAPRGSSLGEPAFSSHAHRREAIVRAIQGGADTLDALATELSVDVAQICAAVSELQIDGVLILEPTGRLSVRPAPPCFP